MQRRSFLGAMFAAAAAPAFVRAQSLMPARQIAPSSSEAIVARALSSLSAAMGQGEFGVVTLYSVAWEVLARLPVNENPVIAPVFISASEFVPGVCGKAFYEHPLLGKHEFQHACYGVQIPKDAAEIVLNDFSVNLDLLG